MFAACVEEFFIVQSEVCGCEWGQNDRQCTLIDQISNHLHRWPFSSPFGRLCQNLTQGRRIVLGPPTATAAIFLAFYWLVLMGLVTLVFGQFIHQPWAVAHDGGSFFEQFAARRFQPQHALIEMHFLNLAMKTDFLHAGKFPQGSGPGVFQGKKLLALKLLVRHIHGVFHENLGFMPPSLEDRWIHLLEVFEKNL